MAQIRKEPTVVYGTPLTKRSRAFAAMYCAVCQFQVGGGHSYRKGARSFSLDGIYRERELHFFASGKRVPRRHSFNPIYRTGALENGFERPFPASVPVRVKCAACGTINEVQLPPER